MVCEWCAGYTNNCSKTLMCREMAAYINANTKQRTAYLCRDMVYPLRTPLDDRIVALARCVRQQITKNLGREKLTTMTSMPLETHEDGVKFVKTIFESIGGNVPPPRRPNSTMEMSLERDNFMMDLDFRFFFGEISYQSASQFSPEMACRTVAGVAPSTQRLGTLHCRRWKPNLTTCSCCLVYFGDQWIVGPGKVLIPVRSSYLGDLDSVECVEMLIRPVKAN